MRPVWLDGKLTAFEEATVSVHAHAMHRGSLVFDFGTFDTTVRGGAAFRMREHVARFLRSMGIVGLATSFDARALEDGTLAVLRAVRADGVGAGYIRWSAFVPSMEPDLVPRDSTTRVAIIAYPPSDLAGKPRPPALRVRVPKDVRKAGPEVIPPLAKVAAAYLGPMLARRRALAEGFDEVVLRDGDGLIAEAPTANVFAVRGGALVTPPIGKVLDGITRDSILTLARDCGIEVREEPLTYEALASADEAFLTSSSTPVAPISAIDEHPIGDRDPGPVTRALREAILDAQRGKLAEYERWLSRF